jgi:hypothetical protein
MQLHTLVNEVLAKNLLTPGRGETSEVIAIVCKENNLASNKLRAEDQKSVAGEAVLYKKSLAKMRELFTYYLLYSFGILCKPDTVDQLKVIQQQHFLSAAYKAAPDTKKPLFTAQLAIDYLENQCYTSNERTITALKRQLERVVRYNNESLFTFMNRFPAIINELEAAVGKTYTQAELVDLWKLNFSKHMNKTERQSIKIDHADFISTVEWDLISKFSEGIFDFAIMNKLLTHLCATFPKWKADLQVRQWNDQKRKDLQWEHEVDYRPPHTSTDKDPLDQDDSNNHNSGDQHGSARTGRSREPSKRKQRRDSGRSPSHRKGNRNENHSEGSQKKQPFKKMKRGKSLLARVKSKIPFHKQCKEAGCVAKGVQATHLWDKCSHRSKNSSTDKSNARDRFAVDQKPFNKKFGLDRDNDSKSSSSSSKYKKKGSGKGGSNSDSTRKCWNCGDPGHLSPQCPRQKKINHLLEASEEFTCLLVEQFDTKELWACAQRIINAHGKSICWKCCKPSCDSTCTVESDPTSASMAQAHRIMGRNPDLGTSIQSAIQQVDGTDPTANYMVPLNHELYYQSQEGQDDTDILSDDPMNLKIHDDSSPPDNKSSSESEASGEDDSDHESESESEPEMNHDSDQEDLSA